MYFIPAVVNIGGIKINSPDHLSAVSLGQNFMLNKNVKAKKNQSFGQQLSDLTIIAVPVLSILDHDNSDKTSIKLNNK